MNRSNVILTLVTALGISACAKEPTVVTVPGDPVAVPVDRPVAVPVDRPVLVPVDRPVAVPVPVAVPGPAGPAGPAGEKGDKGDSGDAPQ